jgi:hypothetical protein
MAAVGRVSKQTRETSDGTSCLTWRSHTPEVLASISDSSALSYICNGFTRSVSVSENLPGSVQETLYQIS